MNPAPDTTAHPAQAQLVTDFLRRLPSLRAKITPPAKETWREIIGTESGDLVDDEASRLGAEWRERLNQDGCA